MPPREEDYRYVVGLIQHLEFHFGIRFFISSRDFDILYRWWERGIPFDLVAGALAAVVERRRKKGKPISGFSVFTYEVKKRHQAFFAMRCQPEQRSEEVREEHADIREFLTNYPEALAPLRPTLAAYFAELLAGRESDPATAQEALLDSFRGDEELQAKTEFFLRHLAPALRRPGIERTYRLNYLIRRYKVPFP